MVNNIIVSICCVTYNHEHFIKQCLDGFVMQKTNFAFEILVHEDASTDNTAKILKEYESKYPDLFHFVFQTENQFYKQNVLTNILFPMSKGKYIALCEGDDYWTDPYKLQKQVDFMEENANVSLTCTNYEVLDINNNLIKREFDISFDNENKYEVTTDNYFNPYVLKTNTVVFRSDKIEISKYKRIDDLILFFVLTTNGKSYMFKDYTAVFRIHGGGIYSTKNVLDRAKQDILSAEFLFNLYHNKYQSINFFFYYTLNLYLDALSKDKFSFNNMSKIIVYSYKYKFKGANLKNKFKIILLIIKNIIRTIFL